MTPVLDNQNYRALVQVTIPTMAEKCGSNHEVCSTDRYHATIGGWEQWHEFTGKPI